jgi:hypothetical protein|eukprot:COSAG01_NODE_11334_length_1955_cov_1.441272_1_plen_66_part_00
MMLFVALLCHPSVCVTVCGPAASLLVEIGQLSATLSAREELARELCNEIAESIADIHILMKCAAR